MPFPFSRRGKKIRNAIIHFALWKSLYCRTNLRLRNIDRRRLESPLGELLGVIAESTTNHQRTLTLGLLRPRFPIFSKIRIAPPVRPGHHALAFLALFIKRLKPPRRITFLLKLRRQLSRSRSVSHAQPRLFASPKKLAATAPFVSPAASRILSPRSSRLSLQPGPPSS